MATGSVAIWMVSVRSWIYIFISLGLGLGLGVFSAQYAIQQGSATPAGFTGPWQSFKEINRNETNPYALAHNSNHGNLKLANFEVLYFTAVKDDENRNLSGNCEYNLKGKVPDARWWSLTIYDRRGMLIENQAERYSFNNTNILLRKDTEYSVVLAANARAGNWIPVKADEPFVVMLRLYSPGVGSIRDINEITFPKIERVNC